jgi:hypothetical protein
MRIVLASIGLMTICLLVAGLSFAIDPATVADGHVYLLDNVSGTDVPDDSANDNKATTVGDPQVVPGLSGNALKFDGVDDAVHIPDSQFINITNGPWANRTVKVIFNCADVSKSEKQTVYEEGGTTRGFNIYVFEGKVYVGAWNRAEYNADLSWEGSWPSAPIGSNEWHAVAFVLRDAPDEVAPDKFEMWMDGALVGKEPAGQMYNHSADNSIGDTNGDTFFHDGSRSGSGDFFEGIVDELWILSEALSAADLGDFATSVEPMNKLTGYWGAIKAQH